MRVLAFRHVPFEDLGLIAESLGEAGIACEYVDLFQHAESAPSVREANGLIFMGGPMSANDELPYLRQELDCIGEAVSLGKPVLGVCLGAQLIAKALGAKVYRNAAKEIGWAPVYWTEAARDDPLFSGLSGPEMIFHWHGETFELPPEAQLLAYSEACRHQAFRIGGNIYGLQFHLEVTPPMIADWCEQDANSGDMREVSEPIDPNANSARLQELAKLVFGRWCALIHRDSMLV